jgi:hypothetical protein
MMPSVKMDENNQQKPSTAENENKQQQSDMTANIRLCTWRLPFWLFYFLRVGLQQIIRCEFVA